MIKTTSFGALAALLTVMAFHSPAFAASFDCAKAKTPREKLVCDDPALSELDTQLDRSYKERRTSLSPSGAEQLQRSELSWLRYITAVCPLNVPGSTEIRRIPKNCLEREYRTRLDQLSKVGQKLGPLVFNRIDLFAAEPASDDTGSTPGFYTKHVAYPLIDNVDTPATDSWNKQVVKKLPDGDDCGKGGDDDVDYEIQYASGNLISTSWYNSLYCHGTPHGMGWGKVENLVLSPEPHEIKPADVFGSDDHWVAKLQGLVWEALQKQKWSPPKGQEDAIKTQILTAIVKPDRWAFTADGIRIEFDEYEGGCYTCTPQPVTLAWEELRPLLVPNSVVP